MNAEERGTGTPDRAVAHPRASARALPGSPAERAALARRVAAAVPDPELPMLTLADLGVLRAVRLETETETEPETGAGAGAGAGTEAPTEADTEPGSGPEPGADPAGTVRESAARTASGATGGPYGGGRGPDDVHGPDGESGPDGGRETVVAEVTPTYSGCPAMAEMRADVAARLRAAGFSRVRVRTVLDPPWSTDLITAEGRRKLAAYGIAPPGPAPRRAPGPVPLELGAVRRAVPCPRCGSSATEETSHFSATACRSLWRCRACWEPFEHVKEV